MKRPRSPRMTTAESPSGDEDQRVRDPLTAESRDAAAADDEDVAEHLIPPWLDDLAGSEPLTLADDEPTSAEVPELSWPLSGERLTSVLESMLFAADKPLSVERIHELLEETAAAPHKPSGPPLYKPQQLQAALVALSASLEQSGRGIGLHEVAGGWQLRTSPSNAPWVQRMLKQKPVRLSRAQLEALAIVAYRQPITRPEIDDIRGVDSGASLRTLLDRGLIRILGKKEEPGRPLLYGTTREFLEFFNLKDLKDLPTLREYYDLTDESRDKVRAAGFEPPTVGETPAPAPGPAQGTLPVDAPLEPPASAVEAVAKPAAADGGAVAPSGTARVVELIDQQLADDAENLAKIDEMIRAVNTAFPLLDPQLFGGAPGAVPSPIAPAATVAESPGPSEDPSSDSSEEPDDGPVERDEQS